MKTQLKYVIGKFAPILLILATTLLLGFSCNTSKPSSPAPNPLADFHDVSLDDLHSNKAIMDDFQNYILSLPPKGQKTSVQAFYFEDGKGQHAISAEVFSGGNDSWTYILIYDKENKRTQAIKYQHKQYQS
jgi:hypothetical protein